MIRGLTTILCVCFSGSLLFAKPPKPHNGNGNGNAPAKQSVADLEYQATALKLMRELDIKPEQLQAISAEASKTAGETPSVPEASGEYRTALSAYVDALAEGDDEKGDAAEDKVDDLRDSQNIEPVPDPVATEAARADAPKVVNLLTASQLAGYIAEHADDVPDPVQTLLDAADQGRSSPDDYNDLKTEAVQQFAMLVAGVKSHDTAPLAAAAGAWLDKVKAQPDKEYQDGQADRVNQVKAMAGDVESFTVLRNWMDREMVDLLSNPQVAAAAKRYKVSSAG